MERSCRIRLGPWRGLACVPGFAFLFLFFVSPAPAAFAQLTGTGTVDIRVSDESDKPVSQAEVRLVVFGRGTYNQRGFTDSSGRALFPSITTGNYTVEASHPDYEAASESVDVVMNVTAQVLLRLRRKSDPSRPVTVTGATPATSLAAPPKARKEVEDGKAALRNDLPASLAHFRKAIELHPQYAEAYTWLAFALMKDKKDAEAMPALDKAIGIDPRLSRARALRGRLLVQQREFARAEEDLKEAVAGDPLAWDAYYDLARVYVALKRLDLALTYAQKAHDIPQAPPTMHLLLHDVYTRRNDFANALKELEEFVKADPQSPQIPKVQQRIEELKKKF